MKWRSLLLAGAVVSLSAIMIHPPAYSQQKPSAAAPAAQAAAKPAANALGLEVRHIHIRVMDVERTKAFYRDKLGFPVTNETPGQVVEFPGLWFGKWKEKGPIPTGGITIGLGTKSVEKTFQDLKKRGVAIKEPPTKPREEWSLTIQDPDGYNIEVEGPK